MPRRAPEPGILATGPGHLTPAGTPSHAHTPLRYSARAARGRLRSRHRERRGIPALAHVRRARSRRALRRRRGAPVVSRCDARAVAQPHRRRHLHLRRRAAPGRVDRAGSPPRSARSRRLARLRGDRQGAEPRHPHERDRAADRLPVAHRDRDHLHARRDRTHADGQSHERESGCRTVGHGPAPVPGGRGRPRGRLDARPAGSRGARRHARPAQPDRPASGGRRRPGALRLPGAAADRHRRDRPRLHRPRPRRRRARDGAPHGRDRLGSRDGVGCRLPVGAGPHLRQGRRQARPSHGARRRADDVRSRRVQRERVRLRHGTHRAGAGESATASWRIAAIR